MSLGISATQVTQLVAQKLTSVTFPLKSAVVVLLPSSNTNVDSGAAWELVQADKLTTSPSASNAGNKHRARPGSWRKNETMQSVFILPILSCIELKGFFITRQKLRSEQGYRRFSASARTACRAVASRSSRYAP